MRYVGTSNLDVVSQSFKFDICAADVSTLLPSIANEHPSGTE